jgi:hypothetical protein
MITAPSQQCSDAQYSSTMNSDRICLTPEESKSDFCVAQEDNIQSGRS